MIDNQKNENFKKRKVTFMFYSKKIVHRNTLKRWVGLLLIFLCLLHCGAGPGDPLTLEVYKLRISEMIKKADASVLSADLSKKFLDNVDQTSSITYWKFKDTKTAKDAFRASIKIFEDSLADLNSMRPPVGLEKDNEQLKKFFSTSKDLANEVISFSDEPTEFGQKTDIKLVKWRQLGEDTQKVLDKLSISSGNLSIYLRVSKR